MGWNPMGKKQYVTVAAATALMACGVIPGGGDDGGTAAVEPKFSSLYSNYLVGCKNCHAPGAPGRSSDTETTLDFSTVSTAFSTVTSGNAAGLVGNAAACNSVPFVVSGHPETSLLVAVLDQPTRTSFHAPSAASCDADAVTDETVKQGSAPSDAFVTALKTWITNGASNN